MACMKREQTGSCDHYQCPFPEKSGFNCVEIQLGWCEVGEGCVPECQFAWKKGDAKKNMKANRAFSGYAKILKEEQNGGSRWSKEYR